MPRIVAVCPFPPLPIASGDRKRLRGILRCLGEDYEVVLLAPPAPEFEASVLPEGVTQWIRVDGDRESDVLARELARKLKAEIETGTVDGVVTWGHSVPLAIDFDISVPVVIDQSLLPTVLAARAARAAGIRLRTRRFFRKLELRRRREFQALLPRYHFITCSEEDRQALRSLGPGRVSVVENFADEDLVRYHPRQARADGPVILLGPFDSLHNRDLLLWFSRKVMPHLRPRVDVRRIVAVGPLSAPDAKRAAERAGITLRGWVDDVGAALSEASAFALPLRVGSGTKTRILDAGLLELPVVTTPVGAEGIPIVHRQHALVASRPAEFADAIAEVVSSPLLAGSIGRELRALVEERFREKRVTSALRDLMGSLVPAAPRPLALSVPAASQLP